MKINSENLEISSETITKNATNNRKRDILNFYDQIAENRDTWITRNSYFHEDDYRFTQFLTSPNLRILDIGCGTGTMLAKLEPAFGVGIDISPKMIDVAREKFPVEQYPNLEFHVGDIEEPSTIKTLEGPFDVIILSDTIGLLSDVQTTLSNIHTLCSSDTRLIISYFSWLWSPIIWIAETLGLKMRQTPLNRLGPDDILDLLSLTDFELIKRDWRQLIPKNLFGLGPLINKSIATLPILRRLCVRHYAIARSLKHSELYTPSVSIVIPCRNEQGNILPAVERLPDFCDDIEIIFVEGHSSDSTKEEIERVIGLHPEYDIKLLVQEGEGKGDAVRKGFQDARGEVLMILDADLTVPPEELPKFYNALVKGKGEFVNGTRLVYPMEKKAMRPLNLIANYCFSVVFSWLLNQRFTDTLCGTKVITKKHYLEIAKNRSYFGNFDPFGDFDLIFGASKLNLKVVEIPIRYAERTYGSTQISRFRHGILLFRMVLFAFRKLKAL